MAAILATARKEIYDATFIQTLGTAIHEQDASFQMVKFLKTCLTADWVDLKLMQRCNRITVALHDQLPADFEAAAPILAAIGPKFTGLAAICLPNYVACYGLKHWQTAMDLLALLTQFSTAEYAIRPFLVAAPEQTQAQMLAWSSSSVAAIRRLASEGMRPRLPWGTRLGQYVADPAPIFTVLKKLMFDESLYVQKSVANNLNDISKDHPQAVIEFVQNYWGQKKTTDWIIARGLRTLFKQGNTEVLTLLGYAKRAVTQLKSVNLTPKQQTVQLGKNSTLAYTLTSAAQTELPLYIGYRVHYIRQNKVGAFKDFFVKRIVLTPQQCLSGMLTIKWQPLSTRRLYPGMHLIELLVNTEVVAASSVILTMD